MIATWEQELFWMHFFGSLHLCHQPTFDQSHLFWSSNRIFLLLYVG